MDVKAREPYEAKNKADIARFEMQQKMLTSKGYFMLDDGKKSSEVRKPTKDDIRPKKAASAWTHFIG